MHLELDEIEALSELTYTRQGSLGHAQHADDARGEGVDQLECRAQLVLL